MMAMLVGVGWALLGLAFYFYVQRYRMVWCMVDECRADEPSRFSRSSGGLLLGGIIGGDFRTAACDDGSYGSMRLRGCRS
jgi:hypothetical protein